jgi:glycosyltransferase 2 family protein
LTTPPNLAEDLAARPPRQRVWKVLGHSIRLIALAGVLFFVGRALVNQLAEVDWRSLQVGWPALAAAMAVQSVAMVVWAWAFYLLLSRLARPPRATTTFAVAWVSRLGRYVPGKVASVLGAAWLMRSRGVGLASVLGASVLQQSLWVVLGLLSALPLTLWEPVRRAFPLAWLGCAIVGVVGILCLHPRVFLALANRLLKRLRIEPLAMTQGVRLYAAPAVAVLTGTVLAGVSLWLTALALVPIGADLLPLCIATGALSAVMGYLALFAPAGLGVREGILLVILTPILGPGPAAMTTLLVRITQTLTEVAFGAAGAIVLWRRPARAEAERPSESADRATAPWAGSDGIAITVIVVSPPRGRTVADAPLTPQTDPRFELLDAGRIMKEMTLADDFDPSPGLSANYAAALATGDVLALVAAGAQPAEDWVAAIRRFFAEHPDAEAVCGRTEPTGNGSPILQLAVQAAAYRAAGGCDLMRPPEADVLTELAARLSARGVTIACDQRIVVRAPAGGSLVAQSAGRMAGLVRGGWYGSFESPILAPVSPMLLDPADPRPPAASIVIPIKPSHRCGLLAIHALARQDFAEPYEIIACLPAGAPLAGDIARQFPQVRLCECGPHAGPGGSRNVGLALARGEVLAFTDADCLAERGWLREITAAVRNRSGGVVRGWRQIHHVWSPVERAMQLAEEGTARPLVGRPVPGTNGATMAVSKRLLETSGARFAEGTYGAEEAALLAGLPPQDRTVWLEPSIQVRELRYETFRGALRRMRHLGFGSGRLRRTTAMRGAFLARHRWLWPLLVPARMMLTMRRLRGCGWRAAADFVRLSPIMTVLLIYYAFGFRDGAAEPQDAGEERKRILQ